MTEYKRLRRARMVKMPEIQNEVGVGWLRKLRRVMAIVPM